MLILYFKDLPHSPSFSVSYPVYFFTALLSLGTGTNPGSHVTLGHHVLSRSSASLSFLTLTGRKHTGQLLYTTSVRCQSGFALCLLGIWPMCSIPLHMLPLGDINAVHLEQLLPTFSAVQPQLLTFLCQLTDGKQRCLVVLLICSSLSLPSTTVRSFLHTICG